VECFLNGEKEALRELDDENVYSAFEAAARYWERMRTRRVVAEKSGNDDG
jgi:hypothetical protein